MFRINRILGGIVIGIFLSAFILAACGGAPASKSSGEVQITVDEFKVTSSQTTFQTGVPYHFVIANKGTTPHEVLIMPPATAGMTADQIQALKSSALDGITGDDLTAGATKTMDYTFTKAYPAGSLEFACHLPGHYEAGMNLPIEVK